MEADCESTNVKGMGSSSSRLLLFLYNTILIRIIRLEHWNTPKKPLMFAILRPIVGVLNNYTLDFIICFFFSPLRFFRTFQAWF